MAQNNTNVSYVCGVTVIETAAENGEQTQLDMGYGSSNSPVAISLVTLNVGANPDSVPSLSPFPTLWVFNPQTATQGTISLVGTNISDVGTPLSTQNPSFIPIFASNANGGSAPGGQVVPSINIIAQNNTICVRAWL